MPEEHLDPAEADTVLPTLGDRYVVVRRVGKGSAASVYLVFDRLGGSWRAAKVLHRRFADQVDYRHRFLKEGRTMARLDDPHVVRVLDLVEGDQPYLIMEYVAGGCALDWLRDHGPMPPALAARILAHVCRALAATHALGIVHRDVKPHNVLITADGRAKLTDFGIAKVDAEGLGLAFDHDDTGEGATLGTDAFMSPEQRSDPRQVTPAADLYAVGATLYALCTARAAVELCMFGADHPRLAPIPEPLRGVLVRACHRRPEDRYPDATMLALALEAAIAEIPPIPEDTPPLVRSLGPLPPHPPARLDAERQGELADLLLAYVELAEDADDDITLGDPDAIGESSAPAAPPVPVPLGGSSGIATGAAVGLGIALACGVTGGGLALGVGARHLDAARIATDHAAAAYVSALIEDPGLARRPSNDSATPPSLQDARGAVLSAQGADRIAAAERYFAALEGIGGDPVAVELRAVRRARASWIAARQTWRGLGDTSTGRLAITLGGVTPPR